ncbi:ABC transporter permease [Roseateles amylovorans]|uniref:ABC transporter permease n=1 Tax=Roseateles amylovorans TaxID=2978473 RepID=A0ABY6B085_9BURK|nr:ABC transporter permease [Roseateles amylovorans]UXH76953.1 ABC transporter permease [Roseateles amylovorans]
MSIDSVQGAPLRRRGRWGPMLLRRAGQILALALMVGTLSFAMARSLPGDMATRIAAGRYGYDLVSQAAADQVRDELALDRAWPLALLDWWRQTASLDLGVSLVSGEPVWHELSSHLGATLTLTGAALGMGLMVGLPLGVMSARRPGGLLDRLLTAATLLVRSTPPFLIAVLLMMAMAVHLGMLPVAGAHQRGGWLLPSLTLALPLAAGIARVTAQALRSAMAMPSHQFARTKGLSDRQALLRHAARHAGLPLLAYVGVQAVVLAEGAVVVESLFAWPGIGHALVHAVFGRDVPMIQGAALCMGVLFIVFNLCVDSLQLMLDPRRTDGEAR